MEFKEMFVTEIVDHIMNNSEFVSEVKENFKITGYVVSEGLDGKECGPRYAFVGGGCGGCMITGDKRNKMVKILSEYIYDIKREIRNRLLNHFSQEERRYWDSIGSPVEAVLCQDMNIAELIVSNVVKYVREKYNVPAHKLYWRTYID